MKTYAFKLQRRNIHTVLTKKRPKATYNNDGNSPPINFTLEKPSLEETPQL
jgi:hypothetical protein